VSWTDSILSTVVGPFYSARTGQVDPWTLNILKADQSAERVTALGPNATDAEKAVAAAQAAGQVDTYPRALARIRISRVDFACQVSAASSLRSFSRRSKKCLWRAGGRRGRGSVLSLPRTQKVLNYFKFRNT